MRRIAPHEVSIGGFHTAPRGVLTVAGPPTIMRVWRGHCCARCVSLRPDRYKQIRDYCDERGLAVSATIEGLIDNLLKGAG